MIIRIEQYNTVIDGLRTQLELQRAMTDDKVSMIKTLQELRALDAKDIESKRETIHNLTINRDELSEQLDKLRRKKGKR